MKPDTITFRSRKTACEIEHQRRQSLILFVSARVSLGGQTPYQRPDHIHLEIHNVQDPRAAKHRTNVALQNVLRISTWHAVCPEASGHMLQDQGTTLQRLVEWAPTIPWRRPSFRACGWVQLSKQDEFCLQPRAKAIHHRCVKSTTWQCHTSVDIIAP